MTENMVTSAALQIIALGFLNNRNVNVQEIITECRRYIPVNGYQIMVHLVIPLCHSRDINDSVIIRQVASFIWMRATPIEKTYFIGIAER
ncbi:12481_t:CDS:2 [Cetraspora pellucida]|uniref:12481_t:CDS:1 n=1 Tax=Cetraspora pellucida TaxID=1433469 RepID=A0ACA9KTB1_9GLOM|nr:12481_t:CDS:2 [Cetraspora pellucida]